MVVDNKEYAKCIKRGSGLLVYIPRNILDAIGISKDIDVFVKRHFSTVNKTVILNFKGNSGKSIR